MSQAIVDKEGALRREGALKLDLGCGPTKRGSDYVGVDVMDSPAVDVVGDVLEVLAALEDESVAEVYSSHLFDARLEVTVPHFSNPYYYSDPTHRRPFGLYTLSYFAEDAVLRRRVPTYGHVPRLRLERVRLNFRSSIEFRTRYRLKALLGRLVNATTWLQELYEENLAWLMPCYELEFSLVKVV